MSRTRPVVAIDGPAGAGKSTVSRAVAQRLGYVLVDTGSLYRAVALLCERRGVPLGDTAAVERTTHEAVHDGSLSLVAADDHRTRVHLQGADPGDAIRTPAMSLGASAVSALPGVREALLDLQRLFGRDGGVVVEGRDIGTVVFPDAEVKVFLTASPAVRARRRHDELAARGVTVTYEETLADVVLRDRQDEERPIAPLRRAPDAVLVDASERSPEEVIAVIVGLARERSAGGSSPHSGA